MEHCESRYDGKMHRPPVRAAQQRVAESREVTPAGNYMYKSVCQLQTYSCFSNRSVVEPEVYSFNPEQAVGGYDAVLRPQGFTGWSGVNSAVLCCLGAPSQLSQDGPVPPRTGNVRSPCAMGDSKQGCS